MTSRLVRVWSRAAFQLSPFHNLSSQLLSSLLTCWLLREMKHAARASLPTGWSINPCRSPLPILYSFEFAQHCAHYVIASGDDFRLVGKSCYMCSWYNHSFGHVPSAPPQLYPNFLPSINGGIIPVRIFVVFNDVTIHNFRRFFNEDTRSNAPEPNHQYSSKPVASFIVVNHTEKINPYTTAETPLSPRC
jgi:hypothetical protein